MKLFNYKYKILIIGALGLHTFKSKHKYAQRVSLKSYASVFAQAYSSSRLLVVFSYFNDFSPIMYIRAVPLHTEKSI